MQTLTVTGIAQETDFSAAPVKFQNILVLNNGEFRIPISPDFQVKGLLEYIYKPNSLEKITTEPEHNEADDDDELDDGVRSI